LACISVGKSAIRTVALTIDSDTNGMSMAPLFDANARRERALHFRRTPP
jgi:hypothetical protein